MIDERLAWIAAAVAVLSNLAQWIFGRRHRTNVEEGEELALYHQAITLLKATDLLLGEARAGLEECRRSQVESNQEITLLKAEARAAQLALLQERERVWTAIEALRKKEATT